jgi:hypothetical protein
MNEGVATGRMCFRNQGHPGKEKKGGVIAAEMKKA